MGQPVVRRVCHGDPNGFYLPYSGESTDVTNSATPQSIYRVRLLFRVYPYPW